MKKNYLQRCGAGVGKPPRAALYPGASNSGSCYLSHLRGRRGSRQWNHVGVEKLPDEIRDLHPREAVSLC